MESHWACEIIKLLSIFFSCCFCVQVLPYPYPLSVSRSNMKSKRRQSSVDHLHLDSMQTYVELEADGLGGPAC